MSLPERLLRPTAVFALSLCAGLLLAPIARAADDDADAKPADAPTSDSDAKPAAKPDDAAAKPDTGDTDKPEQAAPEAAPAPAPTPPPAPENKNVDPILGSPLGSSGPRQWVHALTRPGSSTEGKFEITVTMPIQVNPKFTQHVGNGLELEYHIREPFALFIGGTYFWQSQPTDFTDNQLLNNAGQAPTTAEDVMSQWEAHAGIEFTPVYAKMAFFGLGTLRYGVYLGAGAGLTDTKVELQPPSSTTTRTFGDSGYKPTGFFNVGFRFFLGDHFAIRLEVRDMIYSAYASQINGCSQQDLDNIGNGNPGMATNQTCATTFSGDQGKTNAHIAATLLTDPSTEIINNLQFALGLSVLF